MPLLPGKKNIGNNIKEMMNTGHPYNQARAASLNKAYGAKKPKTPKSPIKPLKSLKIKMRINKIRGLK